MLPGFTANYSIYRTRHAYRESNSRFGANTGGFEELSRVTLGVEPARCYQPTIQTEDGRRIKADHVLCISSGPCDCAYEGPCLMTPGGGCYKTVVSCPDCQESSELCSGPCPPPCSGDPFPVKCGSKSANICADPSNCGSCGNTCPAGEVCCLGSCTNLMTGSPSNAGPVNCGACSSGGGAGICPIGASCSNGACLCPPGQLVCNDTCTDSSADPNNCGACGNVCNGADTCVNGVCMSPCDTCDNCHFDWWNFCWPFGSCFMCRCNGRNCGINGSCCQQCPPGLTFCENIWGWGCTNLLTDPDNCGSCGNGCTGQCVDGKCTSNTSTGPGTGTCPSGEQACGTDCYDPSASQCCTGGYSCDLSDADGNDLTCCGGGLCCPQTCCPGADDDPSQCAPDCP
jgi:hypothetical protein